ncbi:cupin domain-containing protein [Roseibium sp.]|uniref:cupin domain-containing protein n=1 Tax=Roseibium sp. TaxID=1936156 RepID=UPI003D0D3D31
MLDTLLGPGTVEWLGVSYKTILSRDDSGGSMSITDSVSPPRSGPPRHIHHEADETFVVLTGDCEFWLDGQSFVRGPGETAFVPRGKEHTFQVVSDVPCRHLVILTPGGFEGFFQEMAKGNYRIPEDLPAIEDCGRRYHMTLTGPPLGVAGEGRP